MKTQDEIKKLNVELDNLKNKINQLNKKIEEQIEDKSIYYWAIKTFKILDDANNKIIKDLEDNKAEISANLILQKLKKKYELNPKTSPKGDHSPKARGV